MPRHDADTSATPIRATHRRTLFRRALRLLASVCRIGLCLLLAAQLVGIATILIRGELPVPQFLLENLRKQFARSGYVIHWQDVHINLTGQILVQDLQIGIGSGEHNLLLTAEGALMRWNPLQLLAGHWTPRSIVIDEASLLCPAVFSPSGKAEPLLDNLSIDLRRTSEHWDVHIFRAEVMGVRILADGNIPLTWLDAFVRELMQDELAQPKDQPRRDFLQHYGAAANAILLRQPQLAELEKPSILIHFSALEKAAKSRRVQLLPFSRSAQQDPPQPIVPPTEQLPASVANPAAAKTPLPSGRAQDHLLVRLKLCAQSYHNQALGIETGEGLLRTTLVFDSDTLPYVLGAPYASLEQLRWNNHLSAQSIIVQLPRPAPGVRSLQGILDTPIDTLNISGWDILVEGFPLQQARLRVLSADGSDLLEASDYTLHASIADGWNHLGAFAHLNRTDRNGWVDFVADWNTDYLKKVPENRLPALLQGDGLAGVDAPLYAAAHLVLEGGFRPVWAAARLRSGRFNAGPLPVSYAYAHAHWTPLSLSIDEAIIHSIDGYGAQLAYRENLLTSQYRLQAKGTINPSALNPLIDEEWWNQLWADFEFDPAFWPSASFAMSGAHGMGSIDKQIFVQAQMQNVKYRAIPIHLANAMVFMDGDRVDLYNFDLQTDNGHADAHIQWLWETNSPLRKYLAFVATASLPIDEATLFVGPDTAAATAHIRSEQAPRIALVGAIIGDQTHKISEEVYLKLYADFPSSLTTEWVNFDSVRSHMLMTPSTRVFPDIEGVFAGGDLKANVAIDLQEDDNVFFKTTVELHNAHLSRIEAAMPLLQQAEEQMAEAYPETSQPGTTIELPDVVGEMGTMPLPQAAQMTTAATLQPTIASESQSLLDKPGRVDFNGSILGTAQQMRSLNGEGELALYDSDLGQIHILGAISRMFQFIGLPLATLKFDTAKAYWHIKDGVIHFPDLAVSGNTGLLRANGNIDLETNNLNFLVYLHPFGEFNVPILAQALDLFSPLSNVLSMRITGTLTVPQMQTNVRPGGIFRGRDTISPHDMKAPPPPDESQRPPRKLRRPSIPGL